jgi:hypothetical protein
MTTPAKPSLDDLVSVFETWQTRRIPLAATFSRDGMREFVEVMNYETRRAIALTHKEDPEFWTAVAELATQAATLTTAGAKLMVNHRNMTKY